MPTLPRAPVISGKCPSTTPGPPRSTSEPPAGRGSSSVSLASGSCSPPSPHEAPAPSSSPSTSPSTASSTTASTALPSDARWPACSPRARLKEMRLANDSPPSAIADTSYAHAAHVARTLASGLRGPPDEARRRHRRPAFPASRGARFHGDDPPRLGGPGVASGAEPRGPGGKGSQGDIGTLRGAGIGGGKSAAPTTGSFDAGDLRS